MLTVKPAFSGIGGLHSARTTEKKQQQNARQRYRLFHLCSNIIPARPCDSTRIALAWEKAQQKNLNFLLALLNRISYSESE
jgi:hypothetical protein